MGSVVEKVKRTQFCTQNAELRHLIKQDMVSLKKIEACQGGSLGSDPLLQKLAE